MLKRLVNLPFSVAGRVARAVQEREDARVRAQYGASRDPGEIAVSPTAPLAEGDAVEDATVSVARALQALAAGEPVTFVDVRPPGSGGGVPGALPLPLEEVGVRVSELPTEGWVVAYCEDGGRARKAVRFFRARGMDDTFALDGGLGAWRAAGGPVVGAPR